MAAPEKKFSCGRVSVSVFANDNQYGVYRTCSVQVRFKKKGSDTWEFGSALSAGDAIVAARLLHQAADWIMEEDEIGLQRGYNQSGSGASDTRQPSDDIPSDDIPF